MEEPRSRIVREEPDGDFIISTITNRHHISYNRVIEIVGRTIGAADDVEIVPVQMDGVLFMDVTGLNFMVGTVIRGNLLGCQPSHQEWSVQRSCSHRGHRCCPWEEDPMLSEHR